MLCRVIGLNEANESEGRTVGDRLIKSACSIVCTTFAHSPVFRLTGDMFAAIVQGKDYENLDSLMDSLEETKRKNKAENGVIMASGMARYGGGSTVETVFAKAEAMCRKEQE